MIAQKILIFVIFGSLFWTIGMTLVYMQGTQAQYEGCIEEVTKQCIFLNSGNSQYCKLEGYKGMANKCCMGEGGVINSQGECIL